MHGGTHGLLSGPRRRRIGVDGPADAPPQAVVRVAWGGMVLGTVAVSVSYSMASRAELGAKPHFAVFWLGIMLFLVPAAWALVSPRTGSVDRLSLVVGLGAYSCLPKFLAYPGGPAYFDEYAHWAQTQRLTRDGLLFMPNNQVVVISDYPAMHTATSAVGHLTGLSTYHASVALLVVLHVLTLVGIMAIGARIGGTRHVGGIAALLYCVGPGFWFFNAQFAYEAFAIVLFIWSTVAVVHMARSEPASWERTAWAITAMWIGLVLVGSHHLSSYANLIMLAAIAIAAVARWIARRESAQTAGEVVLVFVVVTGLTVWWFLTQAPNTKAYLEPYVRNGLTEVAKVFQGGVRPQPSGKAEPARKLFQGSTLPVYEQILGFVTYALVPLLFGLAVLTQWRRGLRNSQAWGMVLLGLVYFAAYPLMLSPSGASGASRSWSFTNVGVSVVVAIAAASLAVARRRWVRGVGQAAFVGCVAVLMVGNVAVNISEYYRFPGPYVYGSDSRSATAEVHESARWFSTTQGDDRYMIGDRGVQIAWVRHALGVPGVPSETYPLWDLVLDSSPPPPDLLKRIKDDGLAYIVVDRHQTTALPRTGFFLDRNEPLANERTEPLPLATVTKWDGVPWALRIYSSTWFDVYRLDGDLFPDPAARRSAPATKEPS